MKKIKFIWDNVLLKSYFYEGQGAKQIILGDQILGTQIFLEGEGGLGICFFTGQPESEAHASGTLCTKHLYKLWL